MMGSDVPIVLASLRGSGGEKGRSLVCETGAMRSVNAVRRLPAPPCLRPG